jgi:hypothetical protein
VARVKRLLARKSVAFLGLFALIGAVYALMRHAERLGAEIEPLETDSPLEATT